MSEACHHSRLKCPVLTQFQSSIVTACQKCHKNEDIERPGVTASKYPQFACQPPQWRSFGAIYASFMLCDIHKWCWFLYLGLENAKQTTQKSLIHQFPILFCIHKVHRTFYKLMEQYTSFLVMMSIHGTCDQRAQKAANHLEKHEETLQFSKVSHSSKHLSLISLRVSRNLQGMFIEWIAWWSYMWCAQYTNDAISILYTYTT